MLPSPKDTYDSFPIKLDPSGHIPTHAYISHQIARANKIPLSRDHEYELCVTLNAAVDRTQAENAKQFYVSIHCTATGTCAPAGDHDHRLIPCEGYGIGMRNGLIPTVYAAGETEGTRDAGWAVPSLATLDKIQDRVRGGYTRFDVAFTPTKQLEQATRYFYSIKVNGTPIYIDGFLPFRNTFLLYHGKPNTISFGLENLDFSGQNDGKECLELEVTFLAGEKPLPQVLHLERDYIALRDPQREPQPNQDLATSISWTGDYKVPEAESKYNIDVDGSPQLALLKEDRKRLDRMLSKTGPITITTKDGPLTGLPQSILRPPGRQASYGLGLGIRLPTQQILFTFNRYQARQVCDWLKLNSKDGTPLSLKHSMVFDSHSADGPSCKDWKAGPLPK